MQLATELCKLEVPMALSRLGLAAMRRKYDEKVDLVFEGSARFLKEHYGHQLAIQAELQKPLTPKPEDALMAAMWEFGKRVREVTQPIPLKEQVLMEHLLLLIDRALDGSWTRVDAANCMQVITELAKHQF